MNLPQSASVDLEDVEAKAYEALAALETKIASKEEGSIWFLGSKYALVSHRHLAALIISTDTHYLSTRYSLLQSISYAG